MRQEILRLKRALIVTALGGILTLTAWAQSASTGFNSQSSSYQNNRRWGNGAYSDTRSYTDVHGGTRTDTVTRSGGVVTNTVSGRNGNSRTFTRPARFRR